MSSQTEPPPIHVSIPRECQLWQQDALTAKAIYMSLAHVKTYEDDSHLIRTLVRCTQCGHLYFHEFYEIVDWQNGNDAQYSTWIPVDDPASADQLNALPPIGLLSYPGLRIDFPSDAESPTAPYWRGRDRQA